MANQHIPRDPYPKQSDPYPLAGDEVENPKRLDNELQPDPELAEGPASGGRMVALAIAVAVILGAVFYGLNNSSIDHAGTSSTAQNAAPQNPAPPQSTAQNQPSPPATPRPNTGPGTTTGAAPAHPQTPPASGPTGQDVNRSGNPPTDNAPAKK